MTEQQIEEKLRQKGLKVTPQRVAILEAIYVLADHPTTDNIIQYIRTSQSNIATGTVYKVLDVLVEKELVKRVKTEKDIMRYDARIEAHHHLYCSTCDLITDYKDEQLDALLQDYFRENPIQGFKIKDITLQMKGAFNEC